jgi:hypothetical protein
MSLALLRASNIMLRSLHLVGLLGVGGGIIFEIDSALIDPWLWLTIISGIGLMALSSYSSRLFLIQLRGLFIVIKIGALLFICYSDGADLALLIGITLLSGMIAHAPGNIRYYSILHGRRVDSL